MGNDPLKRASWLLNHENLRNRYFDRPGPEKSWYDPAGESQPGAFPLTQFLGIPLPGSALGL
jgi:hypothetical protein